MDPEERQAAILAMAMAVAISCKMSMSHQFVADAEAAWNGLRKYMEDNEMVFYKP